MTTKYHNRPVNWFLVFLVTLSISLGFRLFLLSSTGYKSTDFEVHRNWLAITGSLPFSRWYVDTTSPWTLDYPPFFALFEWCMSQFARIVDSKMLIVDNLNYDPVPVIVFQRLTVISADAVVLIPGIIYLVYAIMSASGEAETISTIISAACLTSLNVGLLIVDHVHFQYNGFLLGLLLISIAAIISRRPILGATVFSCLIYFKHIFLYVAPVLAIFLLLDFCFSQEGQSSADHQKMNALTDCATALSGPSAAGSTVIKKKRQSSFRTSLGQRDSVETCSGLNDPAAVFYRTKFALGNLILLAVIFSIISVIALSPIIYVNQLPQLLHRLFPFGRGLVHNYWAPNAWAGYLAIDRVLSKLAPHVFTSSSPAAAVLGNLPHTAVLPTISPKISLTALLVLGYIPFGLCIISRWKRQLLRRVDLVTIVAVGNYIGFFWSWHVHEKAVLYSTIPLSVAVHTYGNLHAKRNFWFLNMWANFSILPLLYCAADMPLKVTVWGVISVCEYQFCVASEDTHRKSFLRKVEVWCNVAVMVGIILYQACWSTIHAIVFRRIDAYEFLPLMVTSLVATIGIIRYMWLTVREMMFQKMIIRHQPVCDQWESVPIT